MRTVFDPLTERDPDIAQIAELWWVVALRGAFAIALGIMALIWPIATLLTLVLVFAAYCIVDGLFSIILAVRGAKRREWWWWSALYAVVALAAAAVAVLYPEITMFAFVAMLIVWALVNGVFSIAAAFRLGLAYGRGWLIASGVVSLILATLLIAWPAIGLFTVTWMFAFYALTAGTTLLGLALRLRSRHSLARSGRLGEMETPRAT
ncbi:HdeD family acid-resistance protein [Altererythrobacter sp. Root672]|uniref:HdeD family acid-resistance protein n=1 Tax=Altererythrobacter sp. Root672 TaxID=1736584 RepID=UPI0009EB98AC|nr:HdeD family acid-resistance protein [Altererythrobacter sp. Root672]